MFGRQYGNFSLIIDFPLPIILSIIIHRSASERTKKKFENRLTIHIEDYYFFFFFQCEFYVYIESNLSEHGHSVSSHYFFYNILLMDENAKNDYIALHNARGKDSNQN